MGRVCLKNTLFISFQNHQYNPIINGDQKYPVSIRKEKIIILSLLNKMYSLSVKSIKKADSGAGSDTYFITCVEGNYVLKFPFANHMNNPVIEPGLCHFLLKKGLPVSEFVQNRQGEYLSKDENGKLFHLQKFVEGISYELNCAPEWLLAEMPKTLGKIHNVLSTYKGFSEGIGGNFFHSMTPEKALKSYESTLEIARQKNDIEVINDLLFRISLMKRFPLYNIEINKLSNKNTHGDYSINQIICRENKILAVIDWTTACIHPAVWEIMRSFVYAEPDCKEGEINSSKLINYMDNYLVFSDLNTYDITMIAKVFYYQIAVCDYYRQYYESKANNRSIYLHQAIFSTKLLRWFDKNIEDLTETLIHHFI